MDRRRFVRLASIGAGTLIASGPAVAAGRTRFASAHRRQRGIALDAMGEIRLTHPPELLREVIASGTRAVTVTLTDPRVYGEAALDSALDDLAAYDRHITEHSDLLIKATSVADIDRAVAEDRLALFYLFQNSTPVHKDLERVNLLYGLGLRSMQLTYNYANYVGSGCQETGGYGLTLFGRRLIERMNEVGMLVDTSHANMTTMAEAIEASAQPTIISHTACAAVHEHIRATTDANLRLLADHGGVVGICQIRPFLTDDRSDDNYRHYFEHIAHAVNVAGEDHVCIGSDRDHRVIEQSPEEIETLRQELGPQFREEDWPLFMPAMNGPRRMELVFDELGKRYSEDVADKIVRGNLYRVYREVIG